MKLALAVAQHEVTVRHFTEHPCKVLSAHYLGPAAVQAARLEQRLQTLAHSLRLGHIVDQRRSQLGDLQVDADAE
ncbi:hypothetical protein D3C75_1272640 [compost metagenome]